MSVLVFTRPKCVLSGFTSGVKCSQVQGREQLHYSASTHGPSVLKGGPAGLHGVAGRAGNVTSTTPVQRSRKILYVQVSD